MGLINRDDVPAVDDLRRDELHVDALGGSVAIVELDLATRLSIELIGAKAGAGDSAERYATVPLVLAASVRDAQDRPVYTSAQWSAFGARHRDVAVDLFNRAMALSGMGITAAVHAAKN